MIMTKVLSPHLANTYCDSGVIVVDDRVSHCCMLSSEVFSLSLMANLSEENRAVQSVKVKVSVWQLAVQ